MLIGSGGGTPMVTAPPKRQVQARNRLAMIPALTTRACFWKGVFSKSVGSFRSANRRRQNYKKMIEFTDGLQYKEHTRTSHNRKKDVRTELAMIPVLITSACFWKGAFLTA